MDVSLVRSDWRRTQVWNVLQFQKGGEDIDGNQWFSMVLIVQVTGRVTGRVTLVGNEFPFWIAGKRMR
jgi:hypothetical protein